MTSIDHDKTGYVFVYGSLKRDGQLYFLEDIQDFRLEVLPAIVQGGLLYHLGLFPGMILKSNGGVVIGEVHRFRKIETVLGILDQVEEYYGEGDPNNLYRRIKYRAELLDGGGSVSCWLYEYVGPLEGANIIKSGVWEG